MGTHELKEAFNAIAGTDHPASVVLLWYERDEAGKEWQVISFRGTTPTGEAFEVTTDRHSPNADPVGIARETAQNFAEARAEDTASPAPTEKDTS